MTTNNKYKLVARECREYSADTSWYLADNDYNTSQLFETKEAAISAKDAFVTLLNVTKHDVYEINLITLTWGKDEDVETDEPNTSIETLDVIDISNKLSDYEYVAYKYFGQYMISQNKWRIEYIPRHYSTLNELFKVCEYSSFKYHPVEVFKTKDEAIEAMKDRIVVSSVISELVNF